MVLRKITYLLIIILSTICVVFNDSYFTMVIFIELLILPIILYGILIYTKFKLSIDIDSSKFLSRKGEERNFSIKLNNRSLLPISKIDIKYVYEDDFNNRNEKIIRVGINLKEDKEILVKILSDTSGIIKINIEDIFIYDYLSLFKKRLKIDKNIEMIIMPNINSYDVAGCTDSINEIIESNKYSEEKSGDDPSEIFGFKEYEPGDKIQRIHWKLSSKYEDFIVKEYSLPLVDNINIMIELRVIKDIENARELYDALIEISASISEWLLRNGIKHFIVWYDCKSETIFKEEIISLDDLNKVLMEILTTSIYEEDLYLLNYYKNSIDFSKDGEKVYYLTTKLNKNYKNDLELLQNVKDNKVILITDTELYDEVALDVDTEVDYININNLVEGFNRLIL